MATFKPDIQYKRADGTYNIRIRIIHNKEVRRMSTTLYASATDLTKSLKIKNANLIDQVNNLMSECRKICNDLGSSIINLSIDELVRILKTKLKGEDDGKFKLDFIAFANEEIAKMKRGTATYSPAINSLKRFIKRETLDIFEINKAFLQSFESFIENEPSQRGSSRKTSSNEMKPKGQRAKSLYLSCIRSIYKKAQDKYNDEDRGIMLIPYYPFKNFTIKQQQITRKRALSVAEIQSIIDLPSEGVRFDLARDCFLLSLGLLGMNSADMYSSDPSKKDIITYQRQKTKDRRDDRAEIKIRIEPAISQLAKKYCDKDGKKLFSFFHKYSDFKCFNTAINKGLKKIGKKLGIEDLEYYAARHSWATIAYSIGIDKSVIHEALNHVDGKMKITDIYIDRDWKIIWEANKKVLDLFDWTAVQNTINL